QVLACCGAPVAVVGRAGPGEDPAVVRGLDQLRSAGARIAYEVIDVADPADLAAAMQRIERTLGPVTAVGHAAGAGRPRLVAELTEAEFLVHAAAEAAGLRDLVSSIRTERLRLIVTFGSVIARYGMAGESLLALASGSLAEQAQRLSDAIGGCRAMHVDWPGWSDTGLGERADLAAGLARARIQPIPVRQGSRMLLKMLATPWLQTRVAVHGRVGVPAPPAVAGGGQPPASSGRFLQIQRLSYPGIELVCDARLSLRADPYLAEHRIDGIPVLPAAMALEAMAQAASALAGQPVRRAADVSMIAPVVIPAGRPDSEAVIRICALRDGGTVRTAVRCAESGFAVDHFRATFSCLPDEPAATGLFSEPAGSAGPGGPDRRGGPGGPDRRGGPGGPDRRGGPDGPDRRGGPDRPDRRGGPGGPDKPDSQGGAGGPGGPGRPGGPGYGESPATHVGSAGIVDGTELYGPICFQAGRFRRVAFLPEVTPRSCRALVRGGDDQPWFEPGADGDPARAPLVLGNPGLNDATMHVLQACVPHRRLLAAGCDAVMFSGRETDGVVEIRAVAAAAAQAEAPAEAAAPPSPQPVPQPRSAARPTTQARGLPAEYGWDVDAVDAAGNLLVSWRGLRLRDVGPLPRKAAWPAPLLGVYLERSAAELGLDDAIRVSVQCGQDAPPTAMRDLAPGAGPACVATGSGYLEGFALRAAGDCAVCSWHAADPAQAGLPTDPRLA
ncbi:MAG TPA: KR domain-containing protein, partial [Streptosporangiaceae bacterium]|nr:KR domain-containing protein [Streptosporangiaceae bacterium]